MPNAHGWNCEHLQSMLGTLRYLEELALDFPVCCGPRGITLDFTHPHLKRFSFTSCALLRGDSDFLVRHPAIESLFLETEQPFNTGIHPGMLRALNIDEGSWYHYPTLLDSQITHLRLREIDAYTDSELVEAVRAVGCTLRCLELDVWSDAGTPLPPHLIPLVQSAPALDELGIIRYDSSTPSLDWPSTLLVRLF